MRPWRREVRAERALPSGGRGPVDRAALARLAASCFSETGLRVRGIYGTPVSEVARRWADSGAGTAQVMEGPENIFVDGVGLKTRLRQSGQSPFGVEPAPR